MTKHLRTLGLLLGILIPTSAFAAASATVDTCCPGPCCPDCGNCPCK